MGFLDGYEASRERLERWNRTFPLGRIETRIVEFSAEKGYVLVEAKAFRNDTDVNPAGIDYAYGYQGAYQQNMKRWFCEDTVTSAIMRVQQLVMGGAERSTKEIMEQVERTPAKIANTDATDYWTTKFGDVPSYKTAADAEQAGIPSFGSSVEEVAKQLGGHLVSEAPQCSHGHMVWKQSHDGAPKTWGGYFCTERTKATQCTPRWHVLSSDGKWKPQA
tara:strand:+ start:6990 stop:7646 length:657 start_codon:yes stop_codon:yes gene_type:complete